MTYQCFIRHPDRVYGTGDTAKCAIGNAKAQLAGVSRIMAQHTTERFKTREVLTPAYTPAVEARHKAGVLGWKPWDQLNPDTQAEIIAACERVWEKGLSCDEMADHLDHVAAMLRQGYQSGEVCPSEGNGWWDTSEEDS